MKPYMAEVEWSQVLAIVYALGARRVLEWGCGGSTLAFLRHCPSIERLLSIEHEPGWAAKVLSTTGPRELRLTLRCILPQEKCPPRKPSTEQAWRSWWTRSETDRSMFSSYIDAGRDWALRSLGGADNRFDLVLIDGRARSFCLDLAPELLHSQGAMVLHDAQRPEYQAALAKWPGPLHRLHEWSQGQIAIGRLG